MIKGKIGTSSTKTLLFFILFFLILVMFIIFFSEVLSVTKTDHIVNSSSANYTLDAQGNVTENGLKMAGNLSKTMKYSGIVFGLLLFAFFFVKLLTMITNRRE